jgi:hypothetical protein
VRFLPLVAILVPLAAAPAQVITVTPTTGDTVGAGGSVAFLLDRARQAQRRFEQTRRSNLPVSPSGRPPRGCDETVGRFCYWYDDKGPPPPPEPRLVNEARVRLLALLDSAAAAAPEDSWTPGQRVRYLVEAGRIPEAVAAAGACRAEAWWCAALDGFALHAAERYVAADEAFARALRAMPERQRCDWRDLDMLLDEALHTQYRRNACGPARDAWEDRLWWLAKPLYLVQGVDTRTEFYARKTYARMLEDGPSAHQFGFDLDERELLLRFGWPTAWSRAGGTGPRGEVSVIGHEPVPAYRYLPPSPVVGRPANSDSLLWRGDGTRIPGRYAPAYARVFRTLLHQAAMFRRGDSAIVAVAYDVRGEAALVDGPRDAALFVGNGDSVRTGMKRVADAPLVGVMTARAAWAPVLISAEVHAPTARAAARARYGLQPPFGVGARVTLSDMLFFDPTRGLPETLDDAIPAMLPSLRLPASQKVGVFFESYGTNPAGERLKVTLTVVPDRIADNSVLRRLRLSREQAPVSITVEDLSARGATMSPRAVQFDLSTLKKGTYIVQLEVDVAGQYVVSSERTIEVTGN